MEVSWRKFQECRGDPLQGGSGVAVVISVRGFKYGVRLLKKYLSKLIKTLTATFLKQRSKLAEEQVSAEETYGESRRKRHP